MAPLEEGAADTVDAAEAVDAADEVLVARKVYGQAEDAADAEQPDPNPKPLAPVGRRLRR